MTLAKLHSLYTKSVNFVQAYPQAAIKTAMNIKPSAGVGFNDKQGDMVLKLLKNIYGIKDVGCTWFKYVTDGLSTMGFVATSSDPCIFIKGSDMIVLYVDKFIIISQTKKESIKIFTDFE